MIQTKKIYYRFIISLLLFSACITLLSVYLVDHHSKRVMETSIAENTAFQQRSAIYATQAFAVSSARAVNTLWESEELRRYIRTGSASSLAETENLMRNLLKMSFSYYRIELIDDRDQPLSSFYRVADDNIVRNLSTHQRTYSFSAAMPTNNYGVWFSDLTLSNDSVVSESFYMVSVSKPVYREDELFGHVVLYLNMDFLVNVLTNNGNLDTYLVNDSGTILASSKAFGLKNSPHQPGSFRDVYGIENIQSTESLTEQGFSALNLINLPTSDGITLISHAATDFLEQREEEETSLLINISLTVMIFSVVSGILIAINPSRLVKKLENVTKERTRYMKMLDQYVPLVETDTNGSITRLSQAFLNISGYQQEDLVGKPVSVLSFHKGNDQLEEVFDTLSSGLPWQGEFHNRTHEGEEFWLFSTVVPLYENEKDLVGYMSISVDKTEKKHLEVIAEMDSLTEIYNRRKIDSCLQQEYERSKRYGSLFSVLMIDVDYFKNVNDKYGHFVGDKVLHRLAILLNENTRTVDEVGRWGGEEFLVVCPETGLKDAVTVAENLRKAVELHEFPEVGHITISIGIEVFKPEQGLKQTLEQADYYLYQAKKQGRNRVVSRLTQARKLQEA
jgi:diguanylate cyclase (GGDEF)-like protein/PAS domain S-box-containing protein